MIVFLSCALESVSADVMIQSDATSHQGKSTHQAQIQKILIRQDSFRWGRHIMTITKPLLHSKQTTLVMFPIPCL